MPDRVIAAPHWAMGHGLLARLGGCWLALAVGGLAAGLLLAVAGWQPAQAAPQVIFVSFGESIQAAIDAAPPGETIVVNAGTYTESLTLYKAVSLTGVSSATVIVRAVAAQRVLTVTGASVNSSVVISGMTFTGGSATYGGGIFVDAPSSPRLQNLRLISNTATGMSDSSGGGIYDNGGLPLVMTNVVVLSNTSTWSGGGAYAVGTAIVAGSHFQGNSCTDASLGGCGGGAIYAFGAMTSTNSQFITNTARGWGGAAYSEGKIAFNGGRVERNACTEDGCLGGALFTNGALAITNTALISNTSRQNGGAARSAGVTLSGARFQGNLCTEAGCDGGGLAVNGSLVSTQSDFVGNSARHNGGGAIVSSTTVVNGGLFQGNVCLGLACYGGGLLSTLTTTISAAQFVSNTTAGAGGGLFVSPGPVAVTGSLFQGNGCAEPFCQGGGLWVTTLSMTDSTLLSNTVAHAGGGAFVGGAAYISGGLFRGNTCTQGDCLSGGLWVQGSLWLTQTDFISNKSTWIGAGAKVNGIATLSGALFQGNTCTQANCRGSGIFADTLAMSQTDFISNTAGEAGGGAYAESTASIDGGWFQGNACTQDNCVGAGLRAPTLHMTDTQFVTNTARMDGAGAHGANVTISGGTFQGNTCTQDLCSGAGLLAATSLLMTDTQFISNTSRWGGGGAATVVGTLTGVHFERNACTQDGCVGGGLRTMGNVNLTQAQFLSNTARLGGGGVEAEGVAIVNGGLMAGNACTQTSCVGGGLRATYSLAVTGTRFLGNRAQTYGGGLAHSGGDGRVVNAQFARNGAGSGGAALYLASGGTVNVLHTSIASPTVGAGAAIDVVSGTVQIIDTIVASYSVGIRRLAAGSVFEDYNLLHAAPTAGVVASGGHPRSGDPRFVNLAADDYHLRGVSPAVNTGVDFAVETDFEGDDRPQGSGFDIGFDEYLNLAPSAAADAYNTAADTPLVVPAAGVLANDSDPNLDALTAVLVSGPASGSLSLALNGGFVYTPNVAFAGPVTFTYRASDGELVSGIVTVTITVTPVDAQEKIYLPVVLLR